MDKVFKVQAALANEWPDPIVADSGIINDKCGNFKTEYLVIRPTADAGLLSPTAQKAPSMEGCCDSPDWGAGWRKAVNGEYSAAAALSPNTHLSKKV